MNARLEHANLTVRDIDETIRFLLAAFPNWVIRHDETPDDGGRWVHIGDQDYYLALSQADTKPAESWKPYSGKPGLNHLGFEVDDAESVRRRLLNAGFRETSIANAHPWRRRVYFMDSDGNDWEFVEYFSKQNRLRNDYVIDEQGDEQGDEQDVPRTSQIPAFAPAHSIAFL